VFAGDSAESNSRLYQGDGALRKGPHAWLTHLQTMTASGTLSPPLTASGQPGGNGQAAAAPSATGGTTLGI
jgi:hypothetical protein